LRFDVSSGAGHGDVLRLRSEQYQGRRTPCPIWERNGNEILRIPMCGDKQLRKKNFQGLSGGSPHGAYLKSRNGKLRPRRGSGMTLCCCKSRNLVTVESTRLRGTFLMSLSARHDDANRLILAPSALDRDREVLRDAAQDCPSIPFRETIGYLNLPSTDGLTSL
jgi:hypothetical protein